MDIIEDPDDHFSNITLEFSQLNHIGIFQDDQNIYLFSVPLGYIEPASFILKATDPGGFYDSLNININFLVSIDPANNPVPITTILYQNFPNPFNPSTQIRFGISKSGYLSLTLYSILGEKITTLYNGWKEAGYHQLELDCSSLASGIYFVNMQMDEYQKSIKIYLQK